MGTLIREALEAALIADPDDLAAHAAYADLLIEEDDPRGEFIQLQLAIEDRNQPADRLRGMEQRAFQIRERHEREWLGPLATHVFPAGRVRSVDDMVSTNVEVTWRRGWLHGIRIHHLTEANRAALAEAPIARLLQELEVLRNDDRSEEHRQIRVFTTLTPLAKSANIHNLRKLVCGTESTWRSVSFTGDVGTLVRRTPKLEHLSIHGHGFMPAPVFSAHLPNLHTLQVTSNDHRLPIAILGTNNSLRNLQRLHLDLVRFMPGDPADPEADREPFIPSDFTLFFESEWLTGLRHLALRMPGFGDMGVEALLASPMISRLAGLDLCRCEITDEGAQMLANCPRVAELEYLHLDNNYLSPIGIEALAAVGVVVSERQFFAGGWDGEGDGSAGGIPW